MSEQKKELRHESQNMLERDREAGRPVITVDYELYAHYLEDTDLSEEEKREFLQTLWNIVCEFVAMGFGVHPVQQAKENCGKLEGNVLSAPITGPDEVQYLDQTLVTKFMQAAGSDKMPEEEGVENGTAKGD